MQKNSSQSDLQQMLQICLSGQEESNQTKLHKYICDRHFKKIVDKFTNKENQNFIINIKVYSDQKSNSQSHQSFILGCLLFLFLKYRSLRVVFTVLSKQQIKLKSANRQENIFLNIKKIKLKPEFYNKICAFINKKQRQYYPDFYFFKEICFKTQSQTPLKITNEIIKSRLNTYQMVHQFYEQLGYIMPNKNIYLMKNRICGFSETQPEFQKQKVYFMKIIESLSRIHCLIHVFINLTSSQLLDFSKLQRKQIGHGEIQEQQQQESLDKGVFKQFKGSNLEYLQKLVIVTKGTSNQIINLSKFLQKITNLTHLQIHNKNYNITTLPQTQRLLEAIIQYVPLIKQIKFQKFRTKNIELDLLHRLYVSCPYLVDLSIGLTFEHSIKETYRLQNVQIRQALKVERQKLFILQALRIRNITLNNSFQTVKLLLKKGYNFLSALEIIDCLQPICV